MAGPRLFQNVAEQISKLIEEGVYPPGSRLPGERELAELLGVSRVTIREAEIALQAIGRLEIKTGSGVFVCDRGAADIAILPATSAFEVTEARLSIEGEAAALAARNMTEEAIDEIGKLVEEMRSDDEEAAEQADQQFHLTIAEASNNAALVHIIRLLWRMRDELPEVKSAYKAVCAEDGDHRVREHQAIFDALKARDPAGARAAMRDHFHRMISAMLDATEEAELAKVRQKASESRQRFLTAELD